MSWGRTRPLGNGFASKRRGDIPEIERRARDRRTMLARCYERANCEMIFKMAAKILPRREAWKRNPDGVAPRVGCALKSFKNSHPSSHGAGMLKSDRAVDLAPSFASRDSGPVRLNIGYTLPRVVQGLTSEQRQG